MGAVFKQQNMEYYSCLYNFIKTNKNYKLYINFVDSVSLEKHYFHNGKVELRYKQNGDRKKNYAYMYQCLMES